MKNIFFDLYGTLVDIHTDEDADILWNTIKTKFNYEASIEELKKQYLAVCKRLQKTKEEIEILDVFQEIFKVNQNKALEIALAFRKLSTHYIRLYDEVNELLEELSDKGYNLYLLSNAQASFTIPELRKLNIYNKFKEIFISSDYGIKKPNKEFFKLALMKTNSDINDSVMIGNDYKCDIKPARMLGMKTIFIKSNLSPKSSIKSDLVGFNKNIILNLVNSFTK